MRMPERATSAPVGIVGLGLMGEVYARRLIEAGIPVIGFDIDPSRSTRLAEIGGRPAPSIADLAKSARCVILAVFSTDQVEDVIERELLPALGEGSGKIVLCMSTCDPDRVAALARRVIPRGIRYLDVPVSGTSDQVRRGDGVALIGGDASIADEIKDVFDALFVRRFHVGSRRWRPRQACRQSDPWPQSSGAGRGPRLC
jgi:3-hydroxyisobutyrate dehydrogenase-like beta-hydroxyacid dehydrogenase